MWKRFQQLAGAVRRARHFVSAGIWEIGRPGERTPSSFIVKQVRVLILLARGVYEETILLRASALTFTTMLFIVPFLVFVFSFIQTFNLGDQVYRQLSVHINTYLSRVVEFVRQETSESEISEGAPEAAAAAGAPQDKSQQQAQESQSNKDLWRELIRTVFPTWKPELERAGADYQDPIQFLAALVEKRATNMQTLGISGVFYILITVLGLMRNVEWTFNRIWGVSASRNLLGTISDYVLITLLIPFGAAGWLGVAAALGRAEFYQELGWVSITLRAVQLAVICLTFAFLYYMVPNTRVNPRCALLGGIFAGVLWASLSWAYVRFSYGLANYTFFFSTFALFPMLLFWIYTSWLILLFGCLVAFAYQYENTFALERLTGEATQSYREAVAVRIVVEAARRFAKGLPALTVDEAVGAWNVPTRLINDVLGDLVRADIMDARTDDAAAAHAARAVQVMYKPSRDPKLISVLDIVRALRESGHDPSLLRQDRDYAAIYGGIESADPHYMQARVSELAEQLDNAAAQPAG